MASTIFLAVAGIGLNIIISRVYGEATFGVFSQVLAGYLILSQFAAGGLYFSTLYYSGKQIDNQSEVGPQLTAALLLGLAQSLLVCAIGVPVSALAGRLLQSPGVTTGLLYTLPGLVFFTANKLLLAAINGQRHMRFFAFGQSLRYLLLLGLVAAISWLGCDGRMLPLAFSWGELLIFPVLLAYTQKQKWLTFRGCLCWRKPHLEHGGKTFLSALLLDINTRVDVWVLGVYCDDTTVGVYSFALMFAEGFYHILFAVQNNCNPLLSELACQGNHGEVTNLRRSLQRRTLPGLVIILVVSIAIFPHWATWVTGKLAFASGFHAYAILSVAIVLSSGYIPLLLLFNQWGEPRMFNIFLTTLFLENLLLNLLLVPRLGALGAALATGTTFLSIVPILRELAWRRWKVRP